MSYKVIRSFILKTNGTRNDITLTTPVKLNPNKEYFVKLMSFRFQNVFCNLVGSIIASPNGSWTYTYNGTNYTINETSYLTPAIAELDVLFSWLINIIKNQCGCGDNEISISINSYGKIEFSFSNNFTNINFIGGCLELDYFGNVNSITSNESTSSKMPIVSKYNSILLSLSLVGSSCYVQDSNNNLTPSSVICSVNAALAPFELADFSAIQPIMFAMDSGTNLTGFTAELRDDNNSELVMLPQSTSDFNLWLEIVERI